jgi:SpoVK/Ycf46/Vps4 family AAA+-type ATPase
MLRARQKKTGTQLDSDEVEKVFLSQARQLSGADIEAILVRSKMRAVLRGEEKVGNQDLTEALEDFIPPAYPEEIETQILAGVLECTSRSLLPQKYREMDRAEIARRAAALGL